MEAPCLHQEHPKRRKEGRGQAGTKPELLPISHVEAKVKMMPFSLTLHLQNASPLASCG